MCWKVLEGGACGVNLCVIGSRRVGGLSKSLVRYQFESQAVFAMFALLCMILGRQQMGRGAHGQEALVWTMFFSMRSSPCDRLQVDLLRVAVMYSLVIETCFLRGHTKVHGVDDHFTSLYLEESIRNHVVILEDINVRTGVS